MRVRLTQIGGDDIGIVADGLRVAFGKNLAIVQHLNSLAHVHDQGNIVRNQENGELKFVAEAANDLQDLIGLLRIHARSRLVETEDARLQGKGARNFETALIAVGQAGGNLVTALAQADDFEKIFGAEVEGAFAFVETRGGKQGVDETIGGKEHRIFARIINALVLEGDLDVLERRHLVKEADVLKGPHHAQARDVGGRGAGNVLPLPLDGPEVGLIKPVSRLNRVVLPAPFGPMTP